MNILIWLGCIFIYSVVITIMAASGVSLGGSVTIFFAVLFVFIPAPVLCQQYKRKKIQEKATKSKYQILIQLQMEASKNFDQEVLQLRMKSALQEIKVEDIFSAYNRKELSAEDYDRIMDAYNFCLSYSKVQNNL